jgi:hypothetical protein
MNKGDKNMKNILVVGLLAAIMAVFGSGCAAQAQCLRDNASLHAQVDADQHALRDVNGRLAVVSAEHAGGTLSQLASEGWTATVAAFGWASNEAPIAYRQADSAYDSASDKLARARKCYADNGGNEAHSYTEYQAIASKCLSN